MKSISIISFFLFQSYLFSQVFEGITLLTNLGGAENIEHKTRLINNNFEEINIWNHNYVPFSIGYLSPDSILTIGYKSDFDEGTGPKIVKLDWGGDIIWEISIPVDTLEPHHDIEPLPNGNILLIGWETKTIDEATQVGRINVTEDFKPDKILEIQPIGSDNYEIVWEWKIWDHIIQDINPDLDNYGDISDSPRLVDINLIGIGVGNGDWMHTNAISYNESLDQIILSVRHLCELWVIDHSTTTDESSGHTGGDAGFGGDILYRWGNPGNYDRGDESDQIFYAQHGINWIPQTYPGGGNILVFNNRHDIHNSAVLEIIPINDEYGNYYIGEEEAFLPETFEWIYQEIFFSFNQSGVFRLPNGNTLITVSAQDLISEVNNAGGILWQYQYTSGGFIPRAIKYGIDYLSHQISVEININFSQDWNLIGLPLVVDDNNYLTIFPDAIENTLFSFGDDAYTPDSIMIAGDGFWLRFQSNGNTTISGNSINEITIGLNEGWNLISGISTPINISDLQDPDGVIIPGTVYGFTSGGYYNTENIEPGKGYWVRTNSSGFISLVSH